MTRLATLAICLSLVAAPGLVHAKAKGTRCERATAKIQKAKRLRISGLTSQLNKLARHDSRCLTAANAATTLLEKHWQTATPQISSRITRSSVQSRVRRFENDLRLFKALLKFPFANHVAKTLILRSRLRTEVAEYLDIVGYVPDRIYRHKDTSALYDHQIVDVREELRVAAAEGYRTALRVLAKTPADPLATEARARLSELDAHQREVTRPTKVVKKAPDEDDLESLLGD